MEKVTNRQQAVLDVLDKQIELLETKLAKVQPLIDELAKLKRTRQTLLSERSVTGGISKGTRLTMEQVIHAMRENDGPVAVPELAQKLGVDQTVLRSHLNRYRDERYKRNNGEWMLIGGNGSEPDEEEDDE